MLAALLSRLVRPHQAPEHDRLFTPFAPDGASAHVLGTLFHQYADAYPDEPLPPQHQHYRALVLDLAAKYGRPPIDRMNAAYIACFEREEPFEFEVKQWRDEPGFCATLKQARNNVIAGLLANERVEAERRAHFSRWRECQAEPIDLPGDTLLEQIKRMSPDDWHEIALNWNWSWDVVELEWITAQRACDRATAIFVLGAGWPGDVATGRSRRFAPFIRTLASRLEGGFYIKAEYGLQSVPMRQRAAFDGQFDMARETGESPWQLPEGLVDEPGVRPHVPKYAVTDGVAHFHYEYWLKHLAPRTTR